MKNKRNMKLNLKIWARLIPYLKKVRKNLLAVVVLMFFSSVVEAAFPLFTGYAVNNFVVAGTTDGIFTFALVFFGAILLGGLAVAVYSRHAMIVEMQTGKNLKHDCFVHLQVLPLSFHNTSSVGYLLARVMSDTDRISGLVSWGLTHMLWNVFYIVFSLIFMFTLNVKLALALFCVIPVVAVVTWVFNIRILRINRDIREINSRIVGAYNEGISGAKTSKTLVIEDKNAEGFRGLTSAMYRESVRAARLQAFLLPLILFFGAVSVSYVLYGSGTLVMDGALDFGTLSAFISFAVGIIDPVSQVANMLSEMVAAQVGIERVSALLEEPPLITDTPEVVEKYGDAFNPRRENWEKIEGNIEFQNVWFKYPDGDEYIFEDFSLKIPAGTNVAIVGETGAGKSTFVNLACRFYEPTSGRILIDGADYRERSQLWLHSSLGYVLQSPHLFSGTIMENIRYGRLDATDAEVVAAAEMVSADIVASRFPEGYRTEVGEGGDKLSTGEKQLISLARAIIANPPIFVLDEATSSIDTETERLIQHAITSILKNRTSFIIAHRLSTIKNADLILVVDGGRIVESGAHEELIAAGGYYSKLYKSMRTNERLPD